MAPFYFIYIGRSDGQLRIVTKSKKRELNQPTDLQLDKTPDKKGVSDYYTKLVNGSPKEVDWKRKLAGMLIREIGGKEHQGKNYILAALPDNYRLYEHLKYTTTDNGALQKSTNNHAKGPTDRQDAYLYGHPLGRKKRYRSPADFFPHLLWLVTDEAGDPGNCACKVCSPEEFQVEDVGVEGSSAAQKLDGLDSTTAAGATPNDFATPTKRASFSKEVGKALSKSSTTQASSPRGLTTQSNATPELTPLSVRPPVHPEQDIDCRYGVFLFRPGELIWFSRGTAWGLSLIVNRERFKDSRGLDRPQYLVQPLSHPFGHPESRVISQETLLRPWLAWSAPGPTHQHLASGGFSYNTIDWTRVLDKHFGHGDAEVDASIFAAKAVDESYTLFHQMPKLSAAAEELQWSGLYLGGEKIWVGEPIRLRIGSGNDIMILHAIVERPRQGFAGNASTVIYLVGDVYTFATVSYDDRNQVPVENSRLPSRLREDLRYRNRATRRKNQISYWKLMRPLAKLGLEDIKGRWYESSLLLPILRGEADFNEDLARGEITDAGMWMNGRGDSSLGVDKVGQKKSNRIEAFGRAIPAGMQIGQAFDDASHADTIRIQHGVSNALEEGTGQNLITTEDNLEQFLDLNPVESEYAHQYTDNGGHYIGDPMQH
ncbi:MAG: hypothetical protein M1835_000750 [Candelina submexicana]|nr:MAG: hypothetical protein M1835_000750 [Candelina submexicana]